MRDKTFTNPDFVILEVVALASCLQDTTSSCLVCRALSQNGIAEVVAFHPLLDLLVRDLEINLNHKMFKTRIDLICPLCEYTIEGCGETVSFYETETVFCGDDCIAEIAALMLKAENDTASYEDWKELRGIA